MRTLRAARIRAPCTAATNLVARGLLKSFVSAVHGARRRAARNDRAETPADRLLTARGLPCGPDTAALGCPTVAPGAAGARRSFNS